MKILFVYPAFERHAHSNPQLLEYVPCDEYLGSPSLGIAILAANTPSEHTLHFIDDRITPFNPEQEDADLFALSFFTPAASRAIEIGDQLLKRGKKVVMGGIFPTHMPDELATHCTSLVIGEGEGVWHQILRDAEQNCLKPRYKAEAKLDLCNAVKPNVGLYISQETRQYSHDDYPLQLCRGCPINCYACAIPGVMGSKFRFFDHETNIQAALDLYSRGKRFCITEDTLFFPGNRTKFKRFLMDLYVRTNHQPLKVSYIGISMPMILNIDDGLLRAMVNIGVNRFYLVCGFDPITMKAFGRGEPEFLKKCYEAIKRCHDFGIIPYISLLVGTELDNESVFDRMLEFTTRAKIETAEFAICTPYPGTPIWHELLAQNRILHRNWRKYNDANVVFKPQNMSPERLHEGYIYLWREFYKNKGYLKNESHEKATIQF